MSAKQGITDTVYGANTSGANGYGITHAIIESLLPAGDAYKVFSQNKSKDSIRNGYFNISNEYQY